MTMPYLVNCPHKDAGWCLDCVKQAYEEHQKELSDMTYKIQIAHDLLRRSAFPFDNACTILSKIMEPNNV